MPRRSFASLILLLVSLPACTSWQATTTPLLELTAPPKESPALRVSTATQPPVELTGARIIGDSLIGVIAYPGSGRRVVPLPAITKVEVRKSDAGRTAAAIAIPALAAAIIYAANANWEFNPCEGLEPVGGSCAD